MGAQYRAARDKLVEARSQEKVDKKQVKSVEKELSKAIATLRKAQGDDPMVFGVVDGDAVSAVVADWTGIPETALFRGVT